MTEIRSRNATLANLVRIRGGPLCGVVPVTLSLAAILLTSAVVSVVCHYLSVPDPEDLALVYFLPTIFIALFFGSTAAVMSSFASGLAAAYFVYPPHDSILIYDPRHVAELGFFLTLAITGSKAIAVIMERSVNRVLDALRPARVHVGAIPSWHRIDLRTSGEENFPPSKGSQENGKPRLTHPSPRVRLWAASAIP